MEHFVDRLNVACRAKGSPVCVGLDPVYDRLPAVLRREVDPLVAIERFCLGVLQAVAEHVPCVKLQAACFERYHGPGYDLLLRLTREARQLGMMTIIDAKRGDFGPSSEHYAAALLEGPTAGDALTINGYLGFDGIKPFADLAARQGQGLFILVRTSNPSGDALQCLPLADGRTVSEAVADLVAEWGTNAAYLNREGRSLIGAVVGATKPADAATLRKRMPDQIFLVPGFGAQGGGAKDVQACFHRDGTGALITASRSVLYTFNDDAGDAWPKAVAQAAADMNQQVARIIAEM